MGFMTINTLKLSKCQMFAMLAYPSFIAMTGSKAIFTFHFELSMRFMAVKTLNS
jgi:hypothetical protein